MGQNKNRVKMVKVIHIIGTNCAGKTMLAEKLGKKYSTEVFDIYDYLVEYQFIRPLAWKQLEEAILEEDSYIFED